MSDRAKILELLSDGKPHPTTEILSKCYSVEEKGIARIASRVSELREEGYVIDSAPGKQNRKLWYYLLRSGPEPEKVTEKPEPVRYILDRRSGRRMTQQEYARAYP